MPEDRARHILETYLRDIADCQTIAGQSRLQDLIADAIHKAVTDREVLREKMPCVTGEPCGFEMCALAV